MATSNATREGKPPTETAKPEGNFLTRTWRGFSQDECSAMAAALAYYTVFSMPAVLVIVISSAGLIWGEGAVEGEVERTIGEFVGVAAADQVSQMVDHAAHRKQGVIPTLIGIGVLIFAATSAMAQLQRSLNKAWGVEPNPERNTFLLFAIKRILSFGMILVLAFLLMFSMVLTSLLSAAANDVGNVLPESAAGWPAMAAELVGSFIFITLLFAAMFKWLPDARLRWKNVMTGAAVTAVLFLIGKFALGFHLGRMETGAYGAASSLVLILVWIYYSSMIVLLGAEFTQAWATRHGEKIRPSRGAVRVE